VGFSLGTPVICRFHRDHPEKVQALVSIDGALRGFKPSEEQREKFLTPFRGADYKESATRFLNSMFPNPGTEEMRDRVRERSLKTPQYVLLGSLEQSLDNPAWEPTKIDSAVADHQREESELAAEL
jgi:pimeloyl-ACP methyl ester carboxylesterase